MNNNIDALVYSQITNNLPYAEMSNIVRNYNLSSDGTNTGNNNTLNNILSNTTIKRACALNRQGIPITENDKNNLGVNVRIPIPSGYNMNDDDNSVLHEQFGFIEKKIYIPNSMCDVSNIGYTDTNNIFYEVYCANILNNFIQENGSFDPILWSKYKPECACYGQPDPMYEKAAQRTCYMPGCTPDAGRHKNVYLDKRSQIEPTCTTTICNAINQISGANVGRDINYHSQITQQCGQPPITPKQDDATKKIQEQVLNKFNTPSTTPSTTTPSTTIPSTTTPLTTIPSTTTPLTTIPSTTTPPTILQSLLTTLTPSTTTPSTTTPSTTTQSTTTPSTTTPSTTTPSTTTPKSNTYIYVGIGVCSCIIIIIIIIILFMQK
jgi:hypothetical protein